MAGVAIVVEAILFSPFPATPVGAWAGRENLSYHSRSLFTLYRHAPAHTLAHHTYHLPAAAHAAPPHGYRALRGMAPPRLHWVSFRHHAPACTRHAILCATPPCATSPTLYSQAPTLHTTTLCYHLCLIPYHLFPDSSVYIVCRLCSWEGPARRIK